MHRLNYIRKHVNKKSEKEELKTERMMKGQFLLMRVKTHRDFLTVWSLCAGHLLCCPLDPLFISLLLWGPGDRPVGATFTAPLPFACTWVWPTESISRRGDVGGCDWVPRSLPARVPQVVSVPPLSPHSPQGSLFHMVLPISRFPYQLSPLPLPA